MFLFPTKRLRAGIMQRYVHWTDVAVPLPLALHQIFSNNHLFNAKSTTCLVAREA